MTYTRKALDELGLAITNAGYTWTPEMRSAYEKGIRESQWVGLTDEEFLEVCQTIERGNYLVALRRMQEKLKEKNGG